ncbi:DUF3105 domain-containing protein [Actinokineospora fastidiosa]|uniref:DUF3105 domain-containing protein n=1 Tax=Actinokineospora fastidiosa TaxID=1816 RepID=A0A918GRY3_9PSEU|nr:DUF3105 domain-containing protein [Actinokineospora fastidiosa]GGS53322.1 hypothetical protein GCM10010171_55790 [Actinokineospora fastidiosa]
MVLFSRTRLVPTALGALLLTACGTAVPGTPVGLPGQGGPGQTRDSDAPSDPTDGIEGVLRIDYAHGSMHVDAPQRVAYDHLPPLGGAHDSFWAPCMGSVFTVPVRTEHFVHSMEHGAVWITYDPERVEGADLDALADRVDGKPYLVMSPFPGQETAVSVQSWGRQLRVDSVDDERIDRFVAAVRGNPDLAPEPGASCDGLGPDHFDEDNPPPFVAEPPGPDAVPVTAVQGG